MAHKTIWLVPKVLIFMKIEGEINLDLMTAVNRDYFACVEEGEAPIHLLLDARGVTNINLKINEIPQILEQQDDRFGANFIITENRFARFIILMAEKLTGSHYRATKDANEALLAFSRFDSRIPENLYQQANLVDNL